MARSEEIVTLCGWCKRVRVDDAWEELKGAIGRLGLFDSATLPQLSHGICTACRERVMQSMMRPPGPDVEFASLEPVDLLNPTGSWSRPIRPPD